MKAASTPSQTPDVLAKDLAAAAPVGHHDLDRLACRRRWQGCGGRLAGTPGQGTLEKDKPPVLGLIQRGGQVVLPMLADVRRNTIEPVITGAVATGIRWSAKGGGYAPDEGGDGFCEVHVNTIEGFWSWLLSWLRPHRG
ncbi:MAG: hypothetical protein ACRYHQ_20175, partial [Janthinobacterium lividum]